VVPSARRIELVKALADEIESLGRRSLRVTCDVADRESLDKLLKTSIDAFGKRRVWKSRHRVNAAGISKRGPTLDFSTADWNRIMDTNLTGTPRLARSSGAT
jgi:NAD(P)-dependent dehydrogenase (short-subunit alcohol dehydrogenase family)